MNAINTTQIGSFPIKPSQEVYFKEIQATEKGFLGTKTVTRLQLATKGTNGEEVILDQKGVKVSKGLFKSFFGTTVKAGATKYNLNKGSLLNLLSRLEGKKVSSLKKLESGNQILSIIKNKIRPAITDSLQALAKAYKTTKVATFSRYKTEIEQKKEEQKAIREKWNQTNAEIRQLNTQNEQLSKQISKYKNQVQKILQKTNELSLDDCDTHCEDAVEVEKLIGRLNKQIEDNESLKIKKKMYCEKLKQDLRSTSPVHDIIPSNEAEATTPVDEALIELKKTQKVFDLFGLKTHVLKLESDQFVEAEELGTQELALAADKVTVSWSSTQ